MGIWSAEEGVDKWGNGGVLLGMWELGNLSWFGGSERGLKWGKIELILGLLFCS